MKELIARLRFGVKTLPPKQGEVFGEYDIAALERDGIAAADALEAQQAEIAELTKERDTYKQALDDLGVTPDEAKKGVARSKAVHAERDALAEQVWVLRDAIASISQWSAPGSNVTKIAKAALATGDGK